MPSPCGARRLASQAGAVGSSHDRPKNMGPHGEETGTYKWDNRYPTFFDVHGDIFEIF